ncbi:hypothetical protein SNEBB_003901 [Seison nebaliae]|nr:hypothetical protein SNEBB_003901 [Seison nebaliae]
MAAEQGDFTDIEIHKLENRGIACNQLQDFRSNNDPIAMTLNNGAPIPNKTNSLTVGVSGPLLAQDVVLNEELGKFTCERTPERVTHGKGIGAYGYFECTNTLDQIWKNKLLEHVGKRTPVAVRLSRMNSEKGSCDTVRDVRGLAVKFYTECGNWDLVCSNFPVFYIRDPLMYPSLVHACRRNPVTNMYDPDMFWDFFSLTPESIHLLMMKFTSRGIPLGYQYMNAYSVHTYKFVNIDNEIFYVRFTFHTNHDIKNLSPQDAKRIAAIDPDYHSRSLYERLAVGEQVSWTVYVQIMNSDEMQNSEVNPLDIVQVWPHYEYPLKEIGQLILERNVNNHFVETEQMAFSPANVIPGIELGVDRMLHGRALAYSQAQRHRIGPNYQQLPINRPVHHVTNNQRDGPMCYNNQVGCPVYYPNSFHGAAVAVNHSDIPYRANGEVRRVGYKTVDFYYQAKIFYRHVLNVEQREMLAREFANHLQHAQQFIIKRQMSNFEQVDLELAGAIKQWIERARTVETDDFGAQVELS